MPIEVNAASVEHRGQPAVLSINRDITERRALEQAIRDMAFHDPLTGLPNRQLLSDRLELALAQARRNQRAMAVLFLDLDGFKAVNDRWGHAQGDALLRCARATPWRGSAATSSRCSYPSCRRKKARPRCRGRSCGSSSARSRSATSSTR